MLPGLCRFQVGGQLPAKLRPSAWLDLRTNCGDPGALVGESQLPAPPLSPELVFDTRVIIEKQGFANRGYCSSQLTVFL